MIDVQIFIDSLSSTIERSFCNPNFANLNKVPIENLAILGVNMEKTYHFSQSFWEDAFAAWKRYRSCIKADQTDSENIFYHYALIIFSITDDFLLITGSIEVYIHLHVSATLKA